VYSYNDVDKEVEMDRVCSTNGRGGEEDRIWVIGWKVRRKEATRKAKT
jgi:hypothetical protein